VPLPLIEPLMCTSSSASLTSSMTTLEKSSPSGIVWSIEDVANTLPMATNRGGSPANNLHRYDVSTASVSSSSSTSSAAQLPFVLALPRVSSTTPSCKGVCCCDNSSNSLLISCLNSSFNLSRTVCSI